LLVLLHGIGADEHDLFPLAGMVDPRFRVVALRAPHEYVIGYAWFQIDFLPGGGVRPHVDQAALTLAALTDWVAAAPERLGTDPARTYLLGFSQGAMMSLGVLGSRPELLAGVVALSGRDPEGLFPMTAAPEDVGRVPLFLAHGIHDDVLPVENGRRTRDAFERVVADLTYREYPVAHGVSDAEMRDVTAWLAARLDAQPPAAS
jgi:phospholipase/carboxylesterase